MKMNGILNLKIVALILKAIYIIYFKVNNAGIHFAGIFILTNKIWKLQYLHKMIDGQ
jgi:hypothetical protein